MSGKTIIEINGTQFRWDVMRGWRVTPARDRKRNANTRFMEQTLNELDVAHLRRIPKEIGDLRWINDQRYIAEATAWALGGTVVSAPETPSVEDTPGDIAIDESAPSPVITFRRTPAWLREDEHEDEDVTE